MITDPMKRFLTVLNDLREMQDSSIAEEIYSRLRSALQESQNANAIYVLDRYREKPDIWEAPLKDELAQIQSDQGKEILEVAEKLISVKYTQQQAIFEHLLAEAYSLRETLRQSNRHFQVVIEHRLCFSIFLACIGLASLIGSIIILETNTHLELSILMIILFIEALAVISLLRVQTARKYITNAHKHLTQAEVVYQKLELIACADERVRNNISDPFIDQLLHLSPEG